MAELVILEPLPAYGLQANQVENDRFIRCLADGCDQVWDKTVAKFEDFESHMHVHEMAEGLMNDEDYLPEEDDGR